MTDKKKYTSIVVDTAYLNTSTHGMAAMLRENGHEVGKADMSALLDWVAGMLGLEEARREENEVLVHLIHDKSSPTLIDAYTPEDLDSDYRNKAFHGLYGEFSFLVEPFEMSKLGTEGVYSVIADAAAGMDDIASVVLIADEAAADIVGKALQAKGGKRFVHYAMEHMEIAEDRMPLGLALLTAFGVPLEKIGR